MKILFTPHIRKRVHHDAKSGADRENLHFQTRKKSGERFKLKTENFREGRSDHLLTVDVKILAKFEIIMDQNGP